MDTMTKDSIRPKDLSLLLKTQTSKPGGDACVFSPVTDLAMNFSDLGADSFGEHCTPKRRLSLSLDGLTPQNRSGGLQLKPVTLSKQMSNDDGCCVDGLSPVEMDSCFSERSFGFDKSEDNGLEFRSSAFRRFKSMPGPFCSLENTSSSSSPDKKYTSAASPFSLSSPRQHRRPLTPRSQNRRLPATPDKSLAKSPSGVQTSGAGAGRKSISPLQDHDESSQDSGLGLDKDYKDKGLSSPFAKPLGPAPRRLRTHSDDVSSPHKLSSVHSPSRRRSSTPDFSSLMFSPELLTKDQSPVKLRQSSLTLTPADHDGDDGFLDLLDDDDDVALPGALSGLLSNPVLQQPAAVADCGSDFTPGLPRLASLRANRDTENIEPKAGSRRGLFRSPSAPRLPVHRSVSFDLDTTPCNKKRGSPCRDDDTPLVSKRRRSVAEDRTPEKKCRPLQRSHSEAFIKSALDTDQDNFIGDFSKDFCLPTIPGKHRDLRSITPNLMARLLNHEFDHIVEEFVVVDSRYPYEFEGGHIKNALNIWDRETLNATFMKSNKLRRSLSEPQKRRIVIFHCEFSSKRGPRMSRDLREMDREANKSCYPSLHYPELYLLEGGYKAFFEKHQSLCVPNEYKPMAHEEHLDDLKHFRAKAKSWAGEKSQKGGRPGLRQLKL